MPEQRTFYRSRPVPAQEDYWMEISRKTGALIVAAGMSSRMKDFKPMMKIGSITTIQRVIATLQQAGADPVVVVTGNQAEVLERHIAKYHVICLRNPDYETTQMLDSAKIGIRYLLGLCDRILFTPADIPLFTAGTVNRLLESSVPLAIPLCEGQEGHPLLMEQDIMEYIMAYEGPGGIRGALDSCGEGITYINVSDPGTLFDADTPADFEALLEYHNRQLLRPYMRILLAREEVFFDQGTALLLRLIKQSNSVRLACSQMNISYSKGWQMLNLMEQQVGFPVILRHPGGMNGGYTYLSEKGEQFLNRYDQMTERAAGALKDIYEEVFGGF